jgi:AcrR family transcriptional regulator
LSKLLSAKTQEKREKILECATDLFADNGYVHTSVRDIIDCSGFGAGTFYKHFNNKEQVLKILLEEFLEEIINNVYEYFKQETDLYLRFIESKRVMLEVFARNPKMSEIYSRVAGINLSIDQCLKEFDDKFLLFTGKNIQYGIKHGIFKDLPVMPIVSSTLAIIKYAVYKWVVSKEISEEEMIDMVLSFHRSLAIGLVKGEEFIGPADSGTRIMNN